MGLGSSLRRGGESPATEKASSFRGFAAPTASRPRGRTRLCGTDRFSGFRIDLLPAPSRPFGSGTLRVSYPVTAAAPRRIFTVFPAWTHLKPSSPVRIGPRPYGHLFHSRLIWKVRWAVPRDSQALRGALNVARKDIRIAQSVCDESKRDGREP